MMKRYGLLMVICISLMAVAGSGCLADWADWDYGDEYNASVKEFGLKLGAAFFTGDTVDSSQVIGGLEYNTQEVEGNGDFTFSADYIPVTSRTAMGDTHQISLVPVFVNYRIGGDLETPRPRGIYGGFGAGAFWASGDIPEMRIEKNWGFAWQAFTGYNLSPNTFLEVRFIGGQHLKEDGILVGQIGIRF